MDQVPTEEWINRRLKFQRLLAENGMDGCLVTQNIGIYYFTGSMQTGYLFIPAHGEPTYYVRRSLTRAMSESVVRTVDLGSFRQFGDRLAADYPPLFEAAGGAVLGADLDALPAQLYLRLMQIIPAAKWVDSSALLRRVRTVKSLYEIAGMEKAAQAAEHAMQEGLRRLSEEMTELELMAILEHEMRKAGHVGLMRMRGYNQEMPTGMVAAGEAAAEPTYFDGPAGGRGLSAAAPQSSSLRPIRRGEPILIDIGCCIDGYVTDQTRTAVIGQLAPLLQAAYNTAEAILRHTEAALQPGVSPEYLYEQAVAMAAEAGLADHFMGYGADQVKFLGHGIGLELDEWPVLAKGFRDPLEPGMTIAVEPKFTFPGLGVVGIENTYLITDTGFRPLTVSPEKLYEIPVRS